MQPLSPAQARRGPDALNPPLCAVAAKPAYPAWTHSAGVMGAGGCAHGHLVGDAGRPPTGTDAPCAQEAARGLEWQAAPLPPAQVPHFVEVAAAWRTPATEVEIQRSDGVRLRIMYSDAAPVLVPLLQTFLDSH